MVWVLISMADSKVKTPILILTGLAGIEDKLSGLGFGADDYMTKPFHKDELVARIHAIVRRSKGHAQSVIQTGDLVVNVATKTVEVNGSRVSVGLELRTQPTNLSSGLCRCLIKSFGKWPDAIFDAVLALSVCGEITGRV
jgi:DNA-binding response OmpR family regulator